jgi:hypothetical protein
MPLKEGFLNSWINSPADAVARKMMRAKKLILSDVVVITHIYRTNMVF